MPKISDNCSKLSDCGKQYTNEGCLINHENNIYKVWSDDGELKYARTERGIVDPPLFTSSKHWNLESGMYALEVNGYGHKCYRMSAKSLSAKITQVNSDGTYDIKFDDGKERKGVDASKIEGDEKGLDDSVKVKVNGWIREDSKETKVACEGDNKVWDNGCRKAGTTETTGQSTPDECEADNKQWLGTMIPSAATFYRCYSADKTSDDSKTTKAECEADSKQWLGAGPCSEYPLLCAKSTSCPKNCDTSACGADKTKLDEHFKNGCQDSTIDDDNPPECVASCYGKCERTDSLNHKVELDAGCLAKDVEDNVFLVNAKNKTTLGIRGSANTAWFNTCIEEAPTIRDSSVLQSRFCQNPEQCREVTGKCMSGGDEVEPSHALRENGNYCDVVTTKEQCEQQNHTWQMPTWGRFYCANAAPCQPEDVPGGVTLTTAQKIRGFVAKNNPEAIEPLCREKGAELCSRFTEGGVPPEMCRANPLGCAHVVADPQSRCEYMPNAFGCPFVPPPPDEKNVVSLHFEEMTSVYEKKRQNTIYTVTGLIAAILVAGVVAVFIYDRKK